MIYRTGDILEAEAVPVIPVNTKGVMGAGLAKQVALKQPLVKQSYVAACKLGLIRTGRIAFVHIPRRSYILFPTKRDWRNPSDIAWIERGLKDLEKKVLEDNFSPIAFPKLGCGLGGLDWNTVRPLIEGTAKRLEMGGIEVIIYVDESDLS